MNKGKLHGQKLDLIRLLEGFITIPLLVASVYLFVRFKHAFSRATSRNVIKISYIMLAENFMNCLLRFAVGVKLLFKSFVLLKNFVIPVGFICLWGLVLYLALGKDGDYGAPPGMLLT